MDHNGDQFRTLRQISSDGCESSTDPHLATYAAERAALLLGCYRKGDAESPDTYAAAIAAVLSEYPTDIIRRATDPRFGIASRSKWLPTIAEVREFCEAEYAPVRRQQERERLAEERKHMLPPPVEDRSKRLSIEELKAKYGPTWGISVEPVSRKQEAIESIKRANRSVFLRECEHDGIDPAGGVSPSLLKIVNASKGELA